MRRGGRVDLNWWEVVVGAQRRGEEQRRSDDCSTGHQELSSDREQRRTVVLSAIFLLCIALLFPRLGVRARCESTYDGHHKSATHAQYTLPHPLSTTSTHPAHSRHLSNPPRLTPTPIPPFFYCISQTHDLRSPYHARLGDCLHGAGAPGRQRHHAPGRRPDARPPDVGRQLWPPCAARGSHHWHGGPRRRVDGRLGGGAALDAVVLLHLPRRGREVRAQPSHLREPRTLLSSIPASPCVCPPLPYLSPSQQPDREGLLLRRRQADPLHRQGRQPPAALILPGQSAEPVRLFSVAHCLQRPGEGPGRRQ